MIFEIVNFKVILLLLLVICDFSTNKLFMSSRHRHGQVSFGVNFYLIFRWIFYFWQKNNLKIVFDDSKIISNVFLII